MVGMDHYGGGYGGGYGGYGGYSGFGGYGYSYNPLRSSSNSPMIFEISTQSRKRSFCGVMEFIAPEGCVGIPSWMMENLDIKPGQPVQIRKVRLEKGIYVQLQPHDASYENVEDVKAMMEWVLRRYVALAVGDTIELSHGNNKFSFNVLKCTPSRAIAITDQDVSVEFVAPLRGDKKIISGGPVGKDEVPDSSNWWEEEKNSDEKKEPGLKTGKVEEIGVEGVDFKICGNCRQRLPISNILHELSCSRQNWFCEECHVVLRKADREAHMTEFHAPYVCEDCGQGMEKRLIPDHKKEECPGRNVNCKFCQLKMKYRELWSHERNCGAVTELCPRCKTRIPRTDSEKHQIRCNGETFKSAPTIRRQARDDELLCEKCGIPFSWEELQVHLLTEHADDFGTISIFGGDFGEFGEKDDTEMSDLNSDEEIEVKEKKITDNVTVTTVIPHEVRHPNKTPEIKTKNEQKLKKDSDLEEFENASDDDDDDDDD